MSKNFISSLWYPCNLEAEANHLIEKKYHYRLYQRQEAPSILTWTTRNTASESLRTQTKTASIYPT